MTDFVARDVNAAVIADSSASDASPGHRDGLPGERAAPMQANLLGRYSRQIRLPQVGIVGQERLAAANVLLVGAGGLGAPVLLYLVAAGVGSITIVDDDIVETSNLQRQVVHASVDEGRAKVDSARDAAKALNPAVRVRAVQRRVTAANVMDLVAGHDLVIDGTDNFATRYAVASACVLAGVPLIWGSILGFDGQVSVWWPPKGPCYCCVFPQPPAAGAVPSCAEAGVLGSLCGTIGSTMATEALKILLRQGDPLIGRILVHDALAMTWDQLPVRRDPACPVCGDAASRDTPIDLAVEETNCAAAQGSMPGSDAGPSSPSVTAPVSASVTAPAVIEGDELFAELAGQAPPVVVDVRDDDERVSLPLAGAVAVHLDEIRSGAGISTVREAAHAGSVVVVCASGVRSAEATRLLQKSTDLQVRSLAGGVLGLYARSGGRPSVEAGR